MKTTEEKKKIEMKCILCKRKFNALQETIRIGELKGYKIVNVYCSSKCRRVLEKKIKGLKR